MKKLLAIIFLSLGSLTASAQQKEIVIEGIGVTQTVEAKGSEIFRIEGTNNNITISGACNTIKIEGVDNIVTVDEVKNVAIEGTGNQVNYKKSSEENGEAKTTIEGVNNKVTKI